MTASDPHAAGTLLLELAESEQDPVERELLLRQFVARHPDHPLVSEAYFQLVQTFSSVEAQYRKYLEQPERM